MTGGITLAPGAAGPFVSRVTLMAEATKQTSFGPELFSFLSDLRANNNREWFTANKQRYEEDVLEPALAFIDAFAPRLEKISLWGAKIGVLPANR